MGIVDHRKRVEYLISDTENRISILKNCIYSYMLKANLQTCRRKYRISLWPHDRETTLKPDTGGTTYVKRLVNLTL